MSKPTKNSQFHGLRTVIYHAPNLDKAKAWYSSILGVPPYFDQPFYVGFNASSALSRIRISRFPNHDHEPPNQAMQGTAHRRIDSFYRLTGPDR
jgi:catechol 2,3-dioxygenase-like lactoylglutathione lyase family enzyme